MSTIVSAMHGTPPHPALQALQALGDAAALVDTTEAVVVDATAAWHDLLPGLSAQPLPLVALEVALPGATAAVRRREHLWSCGEPPAYAVQASPIDERHVVLRVHDERAARREHLESLRRQLDDRERLLFTSRAVSVGEMGSTLAHELNQPIGAAANLLRGLRVRLARRAIDAASQGELQAMERAIEQVMYAARIIARIREFTHTRTPRREPFDFCALARNSASLLDWDLERMRVRVELRLPDAPLVVLGDEVMLQQVLVNLLRNALDALRESPPDEPEIVLDVRRDGSDAIASLRDNGCGLYAGAEERLFIPFTSTKPSGMGIGLSICRSFVELHQGRLWFSRNAERGSTFHLRLPLHVAGHLTEESA